MFSVFSVALTIFFTFNAVGNIPLFLALLKNFPLSRQRQIIIRELTIALFLMILFSYFGQQILNLLKVSLTDMRVGGGVILFLIAIGMIFPRPVEGASSLEDEPFIVPLAIPILTGPGTITTVMLYTHQLQQPLLLFVGILLAWIPSVFLLVFASYLQKWLGSKVLLALERLMGLVLALIAVQMMATGLLQFSQQFLA